MAWGEKGREMDSASPRYASQSGRTNRNDGMDGFDRWMRIFFLISIPMMFCSSIVAATRSRLLLWMEERLALRLI